MNPLEPHRARKRFGQNFLHDQGVIDRIVRHVRPQNGQVLVEIGPGLGALTIPLLQVAGKLTAIELDRDVIPHLRRASQKIDPQQTQLEIIEADALSIDLSALAARFGQKLRVVGNLPYNISTPLIFHFLKHREAIQDMHFMLQKEVVDRLCASAGDDDYGRLSVMVAAQASSEWLMPVPPESFTPAPKVDSAIVRLVPQAPDFVIQDATRFEKVVAAAFAQRRKQLGNALKGWVSAEAMRAVGVDPQDRAENLTPAQFALLSANGLVLANPATTT
jgi:16S rRNA (adenine1518-N6/adenine1519-N6)-dimethyltransferase